MVKQDLSERIDVMRSIGADAVREGLFMPDCIGLMSEVLSAVSAGEVDQPIRTVMEMGDAGRLLGLMPSYWRARGIAGTKVITVVPQNHQSGLPSHQGGIFVFRADTGEPLAVVDGESVTAIRTAAVSAVATDVLARPEASRVALIGTGTQARQHFAAMAAVRPITEVSIWGRTESQAERLRAELVQIGARGVWVASTIEEAVQAADIVCTVTAAREPILAGGWIKPGTHVNAVGACRPTDRELDSALIQRSRLYVDSRLAAENEAGDYLIPLHAGVIKEDHIVGEIGEVLLRRIPGRQSLDEVTLFKSLGLAVEDLAAAHYLVEGRERP